MATFLYQVSLEVQNKSLWIFGINQDRDQAPFRIRWAGVHAPCPKGMRSPCARIRPCRRDIIVVPCETPRSLSGFMADRGHHHNDLSSMIAKPPDLVNLICNECNHESHSTYNR